MNFALLGDDPGVLPFLRALVEGREHKLTHAALLSAPEAILRIAPTARLVGSWDELLDAKPIDVVIVAGPDEAVLEGARQLAAAGAPLIVYPRGNRQTTLAYELQLVRDDSGAVLCPLLWRRHHPLAVQMRDRLAAGEVGRLLHVRLDRRVTVADDTQGRPARMPHDVIDDALLHDVDLLSFLAGAFDRVTAIYSHDEQDHASLATVTLVGDEAAEVIWSLQPDKEAAFRLEARGETASLILQGGDDAASWRLKKENEPVIDAPSDAASVMASGILQELQQQVDGAGAERNWTDLIRSSEIVDAARRSRARRRTIDLNFSTTSERSIFKSQMAAGGCLLLAGTLFALLMLLLVVALLDTRDRSEKRSSAVGFVVYAAEFSGADRLTPEGELHVEQIAARAATVPHAVLVERDEALSPEANEERRQAVVEILRANELESADARTQVETIHGQWLAWLRTIGVAIVFLPLALFLLMQLLLLITRPSAAGGAKESIEV